MQNERAFVITICPGVLRAVQLGEELCSYRTTWALNGQIKT